MFTCEYCNSILKTLGSLNYHKKTSKSCIKIQKEKNIIINTEVVMNCEYCKKEFIKKFNYNCHIVTCKEKQKNEFSKKLNDIEDLKKELEDLKKRNLQLQKELEEKEKIIKKRDTAINLKNKALATFLRIYFNYLKIMGTEINIETQLSCSKRLIDFDG